MQVVVVGCGRVGASLAAGLAAAGDVVAVVDKDPKAFERLGEEFTGQTVEGIGFDRDVLEQAGVARADALVAVTGGDNSNVVAARVAKDAYPGAAGDRPHPRPPPGRPVRGARVVTVSSTGWALRKIATTWSTAPAPREEQPSAAARSRCSAWSCPSTWSTGRWPTWRARGCGWSASPAGAGAFVPGPGAVLAEGDVVRLAVEAGGRGRLDALLAEEATREEAGREVAG